MSDVIIAMREEKGIDQECDGCIEDCYFVKGDKKLSGTLFKTRSGGARRANMWEMSMVPDRGNRLECTCVRKSKEAGLSRAE